VDVDRDDRDIRAGSTDLLCGTLVELEVQDALDLLGLERASALEGLGRVELRVAEEELHPGLVGRGLDPVRDDLDERQRVSERDVADLHALATAFFDGALVRGRRRRDGLTRVVIPLVVGPPARAQRHGQHECRAGRCQHADSVSAHGPHLSPRFWNPFQKVAAL
jgi:hypothetical protein